MKNWKNQFNSMSNVSKNLSIRLTFEWEDLFSKCSKVLCLLLFLSQVAISQVEDSKIIKGIYDAKKTVALVHSNGPILVKKSPDSKVHIEASISVKAKDRENLNILFDHFEIQSGGVGDRVDLSTVFQIESCNTVNNNSTIKFKDGTKAKGIKDFTISATLLIPNLNELKLKNKYGDITIETEVPGELSVELFSGKLETNSLCKNLDLSMKYSKGFLQNAGNAKMELFDCDLIIGDLTTADIKSKYSEVEMKNVGGNMTVQTFDDKWKVGHVKGDFKFNDKYSEFEFESIQNAEGSMFDGEIVTGTANNLFLNDSKYSKYKIGNIREFKSSISFDDEIEIKKVNVVRTDNSKYSEYRIEALENSFFSADAFDDNIKIGRVSSKFKTIHANGKYVKMDFHIESGAQFSVDVNMQYGKFDHPEFDERIHKETGNNLEIKGYVGGEKKDGENSLTIKGFDNTVYWR
jgi:hypothetical protein